MRVQNLSDIAPEEARFQLKFLSVDVAASVAYCFPLDIGVLNHDPSAMLVRPLDRRGEQRCRPEDVSQREEHNEGIDMCREVRKFKSQSSDVEMQASVPRRLLRR